MTSALYDLPSCFTEILSSLWCCVSHSQQLHNDSLVKLMMQWNIFPALFETRLGLEGCIVTKGCSSRRRDFYSHIIFSRHIFPPPVSFYWLCQQFICFYVKESKIMLHKLPQKLDFNATTRDYVYIDHKNDYSLSDISHISSQLRQICNPDI